MLYPDRALPDFAARDVVPAGSVEGDPLLTAQDRSVIARDATGTYRFAAGLRSAKDLSAALDRLRGSERWCALVDERRGGVAAVYESVFNHQSFTGRSGTMYGYEGLGCIYWHMVSKLLLAVQENYQAAERTGQPAAQRQTLADLYYRIRGGLGFNKTAHGYGAIPTDPYSHTPRHAGELGLLVEDGTLRLRPSLLRLNEFDAEGGLSFTFCRTPFVYRLTDGPTTVTIRPRHGAAVTLGGTVFTREQTRQVTARRGEFERIDVRIPRGTLRTM